MKKILLFSVLLPLLATAQSKLDAPAARMLSEWQLQAPESQRMMSAGTSPVVCALLDVAGPDAAGRVAPLVEDIVDDLGNILMVDVSLDNIAALEALECVRQISFGGSAVPQMNLARAASWADGVMQGTAEGLNGVSYTGKGVVTSLFDTGLDPNHINFISDNGAGASRVKRIVTIMGTSGAETVYETPEEIAIFSTENRNETHGTHVLGIMSGSYDGPSTYAGSAAAAEGNMPYYGLATGSDIVVGCGDLYNTNILKGVKYAVDYAKSVGKPAVVNLSLGSNYGPHDGTDLFNRTLAEYGKDAIICVAAGNEGDQPMAITKTFSALSKTVKTFVQPSQATSSWSGEIEFYSSDATPFKLTIVVYDLYSNKAVSSYVVDGTTQGKTVVLGGSQVNGTVMEGFDQLFSSASRMNVYSNTGSNNDRYYVSISHSLNCSTINGQYALGFMIEGVSGTRLNGYANSSVRGISSDFRSLNVTGWTNGSTNGTISSMACGDNIVAVGSYNTRTNWRNLNGTSGSYGTGYTVGGISPFSSFGTTFDGRQLPNVCAPGARIISSISTYYVNQAKVGEGSLEGVVNGADRNYYWDGMQGTSMACPFAAGTFALWLEADPTLDINDVKGIIQSTSVKDALVTSTGSQVQWGAGKLDALAGIRQVIANASIGVVEADSNRTLVVNKGDNTLEVTVAGATGIECRLYTTDGRTVSCGIASGNSVDINVPSAGCIYILDIVTPTDRFVKKIKI